MAHLDGEVFEIFFEICFNDRKLTEDKKNFKKSKKELPEHLGMIEDPSNVI